MEEAAARRERLRALRQAAGQQDGGAGQQDEQQADKPVLKFRNYVMQDSNIQHEQVAAAQAPKFEEPVIEKKVEEADAQELLASVAPKKANFDLKHDIQPKLDKLERRTQRAILQILQEQERQRLQEEGGAAD